MNLKSTGALFALLMGMLWLFGLMQAYRKTKVDEAFIVPTLQKETEVTWDSLTILRRDKDKDGKAKEPVTIELSNDKDVWTMKLPDVKSPIKVDSGRINRLIGDIKGARKTDEASVGGVSERGLDNPRMVFTLRGKVPIPGKDKDKDKQEKTWVLKIGGESGDKVMVYANSSDRPSRAYPVARSSIDELFFQDPNYLRSKLLFEPRSDTQYDGVALKQGKQELELKRVEADLWKFVQPTLVYADYEGPPAPKELPPGMKAESSGVKGLLSDIRAIRVAQDEDFIPPGDTALGVYGLEDGKESLVIRLMAERETKDKDAKDKDKKPDTETLRIGFTKDEKGQKYVFARLGDDPGVFKLEAKLLDPLKVALANPGKLRSTDVSFIDTKKVDVVVMKQGKDEVRLVHAEGSRWEIAPESGAKDSKLQKAQEKSIDALLEALKGQRQITRFAADDKADKLEPVLEVVVYHEGLEPKKEEKKDDKKADKDKKKDDKDKGDDKKKDEAPQLKKDAKPALTLRVGKEESGEVPVERVLADGTTSRFFVAKAWLDKVAPGDVALAFLETSLPEVNEDEVYRVEIDRGKTKVEILKGEGEAAERWFIKDAIDASGKSLADMSKVNQVVGALVDLKAKRWLQKTPAKDDLKKFGLDTAEMTVTVHVKKDRMLPGGAASMLGMLAVPGGFQGVMAEASRLAHRLADKGESIVLKFGKETDQDKDKPGTFASHSGKDLLFLATPHVVKALREMDLRDRSSVLLPTPLLTANWVGQIAGDPMMTLLGVSPLVQQQFKQFDASQVKEIKLALRTPLEFRQLTFQRQAAAKKDDKTEPKKDDTKKDDAKKDDKADPKKDDAKKDEAKKDDAKSAAAVWSDASGLQEFQLDSAKVNEFLEHFATVNVQRWVSFGAETKPEHKLTPKDATFKLDVTLDDGKVVTLTAGALFERAGHYTQSTAWPGAVFFMSPNRVGPVLEGPGYFAKERSEP